MMVFIGKCSEKLNSDEDNSAYVEWFEIVLPKILIIAVSDLSYSELYSELILQIGRWLAHNKRSENSIVSSFLGIIVTQASQGDFPELRELCMETISQFLEYTIKTNSSLLLTLKNLRICLRKIEGLSMHPDSYRRLAGLLS